MFEDSRGSAGLLYPIWYFIRDGCDWSESSIYAFTNLSFAITMEEITRNDWVLSAAASLPIQYIVMVNKRGACCLHNIVTRLQYRKKMFMWRKKSLTTKLQIGMWFLTSPFIGWSFGWNPLLKISVIQTLIFIGILNVSWTGLTSQVYRFLVFLMFFNFLCNLS